MVRRIYVGDEAYKRLRKYAANMGIGLRDAADKIVLETIDENGRFVEPSIRVSREVFDKLAEWSKELDLSLTELLNRMIMTISVLFDSRLTLADALKSLPELRRIIEIKRRYG